MRRAESRQTEATAKVTSGSMDEYADAALEMMRAEHQFKANSFVFRTASVLDEYVLDILA
jgi:hypothetical protein